ncbi:hypothetical protein D3C84_908010 [compost metagenome]
MQQQVTRRCQGAALLWTELAKGVQGRRTRITEQTVPGAVSKTADARQVAARHALAHRTGQPGDIGTPPAYAFGSFRPGLERGDDKDRAASDRATDRLGFSC